MIYDDLYRYAGNRKILSLIRYFLFTAGFRYIFFLRRTQTAKNLVSKFFWKFLMRRCMLKTGIQIPENTKIGKGFRIVHFGNIVINPATIIGKNFNISNGVTIGNAQGKRKGSPIIGDNVCVKANSVVVGKVRIGNDVIIAPNTFVNIDVPDGSIALGSPCKIILKEKASAAYIVYKV
jgi:serine O-acetyltransferase